MKLLQLMLLFSFTLVAEFLEVNNVIKGEAVRLPLYPLTNTECFWHRNGTLIGSDAEQRVFCQAGLTTKQGQSDLAVQVYDAEPFNRTLLYNCVLGSPATNPRVSCPHGVWMLCQDVRGSVTWYKDFIHKPKMSEDYFRIFNASKEHEGIYTCRCTWMHMNKTFITSASREFKIIGPSPVTYPPSFRFPANGTVETGELGSLKEMVCKVSFGYCQEHCEVWWEIRGTDPQKDKTANCTNSRFFMETSREKENNMNIYKAVLTICKVTMEDFQASKFRCVAMTLNRWDFVTVSLTRSETAYKDLIVHLSVMAVLVLTTAAFRVFMIDLALIFRDVFKMHSSIKDGKVYDAFVMYQTHNMERRTEERIAHFVSNVLPDVLERKYGYSLFICGRDDLPGEDCVEMVQSRVKLSRRLVVVLTPACTGPDGTSAPVAEDATFQLALHQALVQEELKIILIELERMDGYCHLPQALQHLARKTTPLRWEETGCSSGMFWKRVRYQMPPAPIHLSYDSCMRKLQPEIQTPLNIYH
ncbi:interleukin-1 receptor-like 2 isoform X2 [Brienomyrus brachyistius]|uniref:interleukin-1 receptor-like 2 isoform X2 n=1 Tax=Brienomyrus brachyistius TaxID=42636 RepID=UPI0020B3A13E|nr:interleukin-1 receptor-like 2 isoform X2 [Brienomyrus brachyistius]